MTNDELIKLIGENSFKALEKTFGDSYNEIVLRRCSAHGKFINFHTDVSLKTMQLAVNGDDEYFGGRLIYLSKDKLEAPARPAGTITIHNNKIVHGVSILESGTRYGLFFLK
jgi:hypothetical protein